MKPQSLSSIFTNTGHRNRIHLSVRMTHVQGHSSVQLVPRQDFSTTPDNEKSSYQQPNVKEEDDDQPSYVLVLSTDSDHHKSMNSLRSTYFPAAINKIGAHLTLFHALPSSKLHNDIIPALKDMVDRTAPYRIKATRPFQMTKGVGIAVADDIDFPRDGDNSRNMTKELHAHLRGLWKTWLSDQDSANLKLHYTVMNKVDDQGTRERAFNELSESFARREDVSGGHFRYTDDKDKHTGTVQGSGEIVKWKPIGRVLGLTLYEYQRNGHWINPMEFRFRGPKPDKA